MIPPNGHVLLSPAEQAQIRARLRRTIADDWLTFVATFVLRDIEARQPGSGRRLIAAFRKRALGRIAHDARERPDLGRTYQPLTEEALGDFVGELLKVVDAQPPEERPEGRDGQAGLTPQ